MKVTLWQVALPSEGDKRQQRMLAAYQANAEDCQQFGHDFAPDFGLNGDLSCGYCRAALALTERRPIDRVREAVTR